ncbi:hypothetical protein Tco_0409796 [Tanacetum coccineum]
MMTKSGITDWWFPVVWCHLKRCLKQWNVALQQLENLQKCDSLRASWETPTKGCKHQQKESGNLYNGIRWDTYSTLGNQSDLVKLFLGREGRLTRQGKLIDYISVPWKVLCD